MLFAVYKGWVDAKMAETVLALSMVRRAGFELLVTLPVKPTKRKPSLGAAVTVTSVPLLYHPPGGLSVMVFDPEGLAVTVSGYNPAVAVKFAVTFNELVNVTVTGFDPLLRLPVNPVN